MNLVQYLLNFLNLVKYCSDVCAGVGVGACIVTGVSAGTGEGANLLYNTAIPDAVQSRDLESFTNYKTCEYYQFSIKTE